MSEEVVSAQFTEFNLWKVIEALPEHETALNNYLRGLAATFRQTPKVYGNGLGIRIQEVPQ